MANGQLTALLRHIRQLMVPQQIRMQSDSQLLQAFCANQDEHAFAALVQSHGPMVWRVCHAVLRQTEEAEDAFQATFLVLARKASSIRKTDSLSSWLHGVAYRIAVSAQRASIRRAAREATLPPRPITDPASEASWREVQALLHAEVDRLPEKYRAPFVLCFLEGRSRAETARRLGLKQGTVWSRLTKARQRLQARLTRRGISLSAVLAAAAIADGEASAAGVSRLAQSVIQTALQYAAGKFMADGLLSAKVLGLANGRMASMFLTKIKIALAVVVASAGIMSAGLFAHHGFASRSSESDASQEEQSTASQANQANRAGPNHLEDPKSNRASLPAGALVRLGRDRFRLDGETLFLMFTKNGKSLFGAGRDGIVHAWDAITGREIHRFATISSRPIGGSVLAISPDCRFVASGDTANITIWDVAEAKKVREIKRPMPRAFGIAFTPDCQSLATLGVMTGNPEVSFWDLHSGKLFRQVKLQMPQSDRVQLDIPREAVVRSGQGRVPQSLQPMFRNLDFSPDGRVIICRTDDGIFHFWLTSGIALVNYPVKPRCYAYSPDGRTLAAGTPTGISLWSRNAGKQQAELTGIRDPEAIAYSPDGKVLAAASITSLVIWDTTTFKTLQMTKGIGKSSSTKIHLLRFSPDGKTLAGGGGESAVRLWDVATGQELDAQKGHRGPITELVFAPDGQSVATIAHHDANICLWKTDSGKIIQMFKTRISARSPRFSNDGRMILAGDLGRCVFVWDTASGRELRQLSFPKDPRENVLQSVESIALSPDGATFTALSRHDASRPPALPSDTNSILLETWDLATGKEIVRREDPREPNSYGLLSPDGRLWASFGRGPMSKVQEVGTGTLIATLDGECKVLSMITFSSDSQMLAGLCLQGLGRSLTLMIWDLRTGKEIRRILTEIEATTFAGTTFVAKPFAFSPDGQIFATGAQESAGIQLWDLTTGKQIGRFRGYEGVVTSLAFDPSGCRLASGLANGTALIWNVASATKPEDPKKDSDPASPLSAPEKSPLVRESRPVPVPKHSMQPPNPAAATRPHIRALLEEAQTILSKVDDASTRVRGLEQCAILQARLEDFGSAHATLEQAKRRIAEMPDDRQPEEGRALAKACAQAGDLDELQKVIEWLPIPKRPSGTRDYRQMVRAEAANALAQSGKIKEAQGFAQGVKSANNANPTHARLLGLAATHFVLAGDMKQAWALLDAISDPSTKVSILAGTISDGRWNQDLPNPPGGIALRLDESGNRPEAQRMLKLAVEIASKIKDPTKQARALSGIACCQACVGDPEGVRTTQGKIPTDSKYRPYSTMAMARTQAAAGQTEAAVRTLGSLESAQLQAEGLCQLAAGQVAAGDRKGALASCDKAWLLIQTFREPFVRTAGRTLINVRIQAKDYAGAAAVSAIISPGADPLTYGAIASHQARAGDFDTALKTIEDHISQFGFFERQDLQRLALMQTEHNQEKEGLAWARKMTKPEEQAYALLGVAEGLFKRIK